MYHPPTNSCGRLPRIPNDFAYYSCRCVSFGHRLIVMGLVDGENEGATFVYNFCSCRWQRGTNMLVGRWLFSCAVDSIKGLIYSVGGLDSINGLIYFAHGLNEDIKGVRSAEVYNVEEDRWMS
ncbi:hypothetical protein SUGI_0345280 [Cryptomeria japonica]|nr:hypothetical protein SUGI_0345280 [Cryptomeria japonica]